MIYWHFMDYRTPAGENQPKLWIEGLAASERGKVRRKLNAKITAFMQMHNLRPPDFESLAGYPGILEMRFKVNKVVYRPLCCYGPGRRQVTILVGAKEIGDKIVPESAPRTAMDRMHAINDDGRLVCPHDFNQGI